MMVIEVYHENAAAEAGLEGARRNRDVVEETEAHAAIRLGVMAGGTHQRKDRFFTCNTGEHGLDCAAGRSASHAKRACVHERIAGRKISGLESPFRLASRELEILRRVHAQDLVVACIASCESVDEHAVRCQTPCDRFNAIGPLRMDDVAQVIPVKGIDDELQPDFLLVGDLHESAAPFCTVA
jgi:hypothetical protein